MGCGDLEKVLNQNKSNPFVRMHLSSFILNLYSLMLIILQSIWPGFGLSKMKSNGQSANIQELQTHPIQIVRIRVIKAKKL